MERRKITRRVNADEADLRLNSLQMEKSTLKQRIIAHAPPEWIEIESIVDSLCGGGEFPIWEYAERACLSAGGSYNDALDAVAALFCAVAAVKLVDDLIDEDPEGKHHELGIGRTANLALAFQALGGKILVMGASAEAISQRSWIAYSRACIDTAFGQELDAREVSTEEEYWRQVEAKTPPLFARGFEMGALAAGANDDTIAKLVELGTLLGKLVQVSDDMSDAYKRPAKEDWNRPGNNLALLFASSVAHDEREMFKCLAERVSDETALHEAQAILTRSGAASYCAFKMLGFKDAIEALFEELDFPNPQPLRELLDYCIGPVDLLMEIAAQEGAIQG